MVKEIIEDAKSRMTKSLQSLEGNFSKIRAGERIHPYLNKLVLSIMVLKFPSLKFQI
jgi:ribosome recycling factor